MCARRSAAAAVALLALTLAGCRQAPPSPAPHHVRYRLDWAVEGAEGRGAAGWSVTTDLGYRVHVTRGYVTSYSMELVECPRQSPTPIARAGDVLRALAGEGTAFAGHSAGTPNPAAIRPMRIESLTSPAPAEVGDVLLQPQAYCQLHYLIARAGPDAVGFPGDVEMHDTSLHVEGTFRVPGGTTDMPFTVHTAVANGGLFDRATGAREPMRFDTGTSALQVTVRRRLARMFDGVDFATMTDRMVASQILKALIDHVEVEIVPVDEHA